MTNLNRAEKAIKQAELDHEIQQVAKNHVLGLTADEFLASIKIRWGLFNDLPEHNDPLLDTYVAHAALNHYLAVPMTLDKVAQLIVWELESDCPLDELERVALKRGLLIHDTEGRVIPNRLDFPDLFTNPGDLSPNPGDPDETIYDPALIKATTGPNRLRELQNSFNTFGTFAVAQLWLDYQEWNAENAHNDGEEDE